MNNGLLGNDVVCVCVYASLSATRTPPTEHAPAIRRVHVYIEGAKGNAGREGHPLAVRVSHAAVAGARDLAHNGLARVGAQLVGLYHPTMAVAHHGTKGTKAIAAPEGPRSARRPVGIVKRVQVSVTGKGRVVRPAHPGARVQAREPVEARRGVAWQPSCICGTVGCCCSRCGRGCGAGRRGSGVWVCGGCCGAQGEAEPPQREERKGRTLSAPGRLRCHHVPRRKVLKRGGRGRKGGVGRRRGGNFPERVRGQLPLLRAHPARDGQRLLAWPPTAVQDSQDPKNAREGWADKTLEQGLCSEWKCVDQQGVCAKGANVQYPH